MNISVSKNIPILERYHLQSPTKSFKVFNRVKFGEPNTSTDASACGLISSRQNSPRKRQPVWRLLFRKKAAICLLLASLAVGILSAAPPVSLTSAGIRVDVSIVQNEVIEQFWVKRNSAWVLIAKSEGKTTGPLSVKEFSGIQKSQTQTVVKEGDVIVETFRGDGWSVKRSIRPEGNRGWLKVTSVLNPERPLTMHSFADTFQTVFKPSWSYSPSIGGFNPDAKYKAPLILVQSGSIAFGIVPDLLSLNREVLQRCNHAMDLNVPGKTALTVGFVPARQAFHTVFKEDLDRSWTASEAVENSYYIYLAGNAPANQAYREAVRFHWEKFGRVEQAKAADEQSGTDPRYQRCGLWDDWRKAVWNVESPEEWLTVPMPDGSIGGAVSMLRAGSPRRSVYLGAWFNSLRTSCGMALYARRTGDTKLLELAQQTLNLALKAPGPNGAFKCFAVPGETPDQVFWGAGDGAVVSVNSGYLGFDMSWTGFWMLKWREAGLPGADAVLARCTRLADFLISRQRADGWLPTRFDESGAVDDNSAASVPAETAPVARFLFELYKAAGDRRYSQAALKALAYIDRDIVPERKWYDFETFWSCSPRVNTFDERTQQWPANNLALIHAPAAYLQAYQVTHQPEYLSKGKAVLDYLVLYQQSWTNPVLENLTSKAELFGGFATQNSDAEWSDARQSLAGEVLIDYYRETGNAEYLERGIGALRAQFPISPSENWAHTGYGKKAGVSSFHWGAGSGMAGIEMEEELLHDAICDLNAGRCAGVNGLNILDVSIKDKTIALKVESPYAWSRKPVFVFRGAASADSYSVSINGSQAQVYSGKQLAAGVPLELLCCITNLQPSGPSGGGN